MVDLSNNEYTHQSMKEIIVDFDGTICKYAFPECGEPTPKVHEALNFLRSIGYKITIHSCRTSHYWQMLFGQDPMKQLEIMIDYLKKYNIPYDRICLLEKPVADYYIDDRAIQFKGSWEDTLTELTNRETLRTEECLKQENT